MTTSRVEKFIVRKVRKRKQHNNDMIDGWYYGLTEKKINIDTHIIFKPYDLNLKVVLNIGTVHMKTCTAFLDFRQEIQSAAINFKIMDDFSCCGLLIYCTTQICLQHAMHATKFSVEMWRCAGEKCKKKQLKSCIDSAMN